ncbi:MAG: ferredoxin--nitrite reductase, partial [Epsilonproteobacteria bacterium]|nr:ferredoxin--nitrite reductase [Campylobacterota bacterium]NPA65234.1 ferredoxin--nitrite reductase [Campylobacterota bacterium]
VPLKESKVRIYWSACVKGCGIHEWGDIGFVGAKAKDGDEVVHGVDILLGGSLTKLTEAQTILKAVPLRYAKELIKELMIEFKQSKKRHFEEFYFDNLHPFSKGAIGFLMKFNAYLSRLGIEYRFSLANHKPIGRFEPLEIFDFGNAIYKALTADKAYLEIYNFQPIGSAKPQHPSKINKAIPKELGDIVYKMVHPNLNERYQVFSEILKDISL